MRRLSVLVGFAVLILIACNGEAATDTVSADVDVSAPSSMHLTVHKTPTCGCCGDWVDHVKSEGFSVTVHEHADLSPIRQRLGIPLELSSCHSAETAGYVLEGHIPASDIKRLLTERPDATGLSVPGMPAGSPGMEVDGYSQPYATLIFDHEGASVFALHNGASPQ